jgi:hypothetical protein
MFMHVSNKERKNTQKIDENMWETKHISNYILIK